ncbi:MAG: transcriptional regulator [Gammaproteobacteria bacterium]|nr:transcriptional regulator [Gammaproteobacteria bacterium]
MASRAAAAKRATQGTRKSARARLQEVPGKSSVADDKHVDRLIYERVRLGILSALAVNDELPFNALKTMFDTSDGNLSAHARKLEDAGYIKVSKGFEGRRPKTVFRLTAAGRKALNRYLDHMEAVIAATRGS